MTDNTIEVQNLAVSYDGQPILQDISFSLASGQMIGMIGPNGAGKSTLIKAMLGLIRVQQGRVTVGGKSVDDVRKQIAYVPQRKQIDFDSPISVFDTVLLGTYPKLSWFRRPKQQHRDLAQQSLVAVGMEKFASRQIGELSGGQQQRVFLARALAQEADWLFFDEPFVGVDVESEAYMVDVLKSLRDAGKTLLIVHHDLSKAAAYFDELLLLNQVLLGQGPAAEVMQPDTLAKAYRLDPFLWSGKEVTVG